MTSDGGQTERIVMLREHLATMVDGLREWSRDGGPKLTVGDATDCRVDRDDHPQGWTYVEMPVIVGGFEVPLVMEFGNEEGDAIHFELYAGRATRLLRALAGNPAPIRAMLDAVSREVEESLARLPRDGSRPTLRRVTLAGISLDDHHPLELGPHGMHMRARIHLDVQDGPSMVLEVKPGEFDGTLREELDGRSADPGD